MPTDPKRLQHPSPISLFLWSMRAREGWYSLMLAGCNPSHASLLEDERDRARQREGDNPVVLKVVSQREMVGKFSLPHLEKAGWVPLLHHTRFPFLASFRGRRRSFLFLSLFVTLLLRQLFHGAKGLAAMTPGVPGHRTQQRPQHILPSEVKSRIAQR